MPNHLYRRTFLQMPPKTKPYLRNPISGWGSTSSSCTSTSSTSSTKLGHSHNTARCQQCIHEVNCLDRILRTGSCTNYELDEGKAWKKINKKFKKDIPGAIYDEPDPRDPVDFEKNWIWRTINDACKKINERLEKRRGYPQ